MFVTILLLNGVEFHILIVSRGSLLLVSVFGWVRAYRSTKCYGLLALLLFRWVYLLDLSWTAKTLLRATCMLWIYLVSVGFPRLRCGNRLVLQRSHGQVIVDYLDLWIWTIHALHAEAWLRVRVQVLEYWPLRVICINRVIRLQFIVWSLSIVLPIHDFDIEGSMIINLCHWNRVWISVDCDQCTKRVQQCAVISSTVDFVHQIFGIV